MGKFLHSLRTGLIAAAFGFGPATAYSHSAIQAGPPPAGGAQPSLSAPPASAEALLAKLFQPWASSNSPGCVTAVKQRGKLLHTRAFGMADLERGVPNTPATLFEIGSNAKQFTAAAILLLVADGKIKLSDDVRTYIPELPDYGAKITIDHLLNHTSGLRDWGEIAALQGWERTTRAHTNIDALDLIIRQRELNYQPGANYSYTNSGYVLLPLIVEKVSGTSFPDFTRKRIFMPLGMTHTQWRDDFNRVVKNRAIAYWKRGSDYSQLMPFENVYGPGGLLTTANDMLIWNEALDEGRLGRFVTDELQREAKSNEGRPIGYARGLFVGDYKGTRMVSHGGSTGAYQANLTRYPQAGLSFVLLCNADEVPTRDIEDQIVDHYLGLPPRPTKLQSRVQLKAEQLAERSGTWVFEFTGLPVILSSDGGRLNWNGNPLDAVSANEFRSSGSRRVVFHGRDSLDMSVDNTTERFRRAKGLPLSAEDMRSIAGRYWSDEVGTGYIARVENGKLTLRNEQWSRVYAPFDAIARDLFRIGSIALRIERDAAGAPSAIVFSVPRVRALRFQRTSLAGR